MRGWLRRLRGVLGIGALWGGVGSVVGAVAGLATGVLGGLPLGYLVPMFALYTGATTFLLGAGFSLILTSRRLRGTVGEPSMRRFAAIGAVAGAALPFAWLLVPVGELLTDLTALPVGQFLSVVFGAAVTCGVLGAGMASATVTIARRAPDELGAGDVAHEPLLTTTVHGERREEEASVR